MAGTSPAMTRRRSEHEVSIWQTPDQIRRPLFRRCEISFNQGAEWNALISKYIGNIPLSGEVSDIPEQCISAPPPSTPVISAMIAKAGAAARHNHSAAMPAAALRLP